MKKLLVVAVAAFAAGASVPAFAGGCGGGNCAAKDSCGFACENPCPLAQDANTLRGLGRESLGVSTSVRASVSTMVQRNLSRV